MARDDQDDQIQAILEVGRQTRKPTPRWLWITAALVGVICATGFLVAFLGDTEAPGRPVARRASPGAGFATGLWIGAAGGVVIGFAVGRHRRDHSSRNRP